MDWFIQHAQDILSVIGGASIIATVTPTKKDDKVLEFIGTLVNVLAFNFGNAKNNVDKNKK